MSDGGDEAPAWRRTMAGVIDWALIGAVVGAMAWPGETPPAMALVMLGSAVAMFYAMAFEGSPLAATPGKLLLRLRLEPSDGAPGFATAALHAWPWWLPGAVAGIVPSAWPIAALLSIGCIVLIPVSGSGQGLHDHMAGTRVTVRARGTTGD